MHWASQELQRWRNVKISARYDPFHYGCHEHIFFQVPGSVFQLGEFLHSLHKVGDFHLVRSSNLLISSSNTASGRSNHSFNSPSTAARHSAILLCTKHCTREKFRPRTKHPETWITSKIYRTFCFYRKKDARRLKLQQAVALMPQRMRRDPAPRGAECFVLWSYSNQVSLVSKIDLSFLWTEQFHT